MDEDMDTDVAQAEVMLQLRQMNISQEQPPASLPATASSESVASLASVSSVSSMSEADSGMGSESDKVEFRFLYFDFNHINININRMNLWRATMKMPRAQKVHNRSNKSNL